MGETKLPASRSEQPEIDTGRLYLSCITLNWLLKCMGVKFSKVIRFFQPLKINCSYSNGFGHKTHSTTHCNDLICRWYSMLAIWSYLAKKLPWRIIARNKVRISISSQLHDIFFGTREIHWLYFLPTVSQGDPRLHKDRANSFCPVHMWVTRSQFQKGFNLYKLNSRIDAFLLFWILA